jgi:hypothetical protein
VSGAGADNAVARTRGVLRRLTVLALVAFVGLAYLTFLSAALAPSAALVGALGLEAADAGQGLREGAPAPRPAAAPTLSAAATGALTLASLTVQLCGAAPGEVAAPLAAVTLTGLWARGGRREGLAADDAAKRTAGFDATAIVPTNFVMRACVGPDTLGGEAVEPGDVVYLFLGSATGCPFSRLTSLPFGAGSHYCSGAALTQVMLKSVRSVLGRMRADCGRISSTPEVEGKAGAFLVFATES